VFSGGESPPETQFSLWQCRELSTHAARSAAVMSIPNNTLPSASAFEREALPFLPNVARYARLLTRDAADADDLTQETFLRAYQNWNTFRPDSDCRKWLFTICRNIYLRDRQRSERFVPIDSPEADLSVMRALYDRAVVNGLSHVFDRIDLGPALARAVRALQPEYRDALLVVDVEDRTYADAAAIAGVPIGTIRSRLFRARRLLQQALLEHARDIGLVRDAREITPAV
jgi:RNA polymerase sigma-70 factor (ECF subfamily)